MYGALSEIKMPLARLIYCALISDWLETAESFNFYLNSFSLFIYLLLQSDRFFNCLH